MQVYIAPRQAGKTDALIREAAKRHLVIVTPTKVDARRIRRRTVELGLMAEVLDPITWKEFVGGGARGVAIEGYLIDDLDRCIQSFATATVHGFSLTSDSPQLRTI